MLAKVDLHMHLVLLEIYSFLIRRSDSWLHEQKQACSRCPRLEREREPCELSNVGILECSLSTLKFSPVPYQHLGTHSYRVLN